MTFDDLVMTSVTTNYNTIIRPKLCCSLNTLVERLKVKGPHIYVPQRTGKPKQQRFTIQSGVLTSTSSRQGGAISGRPLPERTDFGPAVAARQTHLPQSAALWPSPRNVLRQRLAILVGSSNYQAL